MRPYRIVVVPPAFNNDLCLLQGENVFAVELLITQFADEAFAIAVLPSAFWLDVGPLGASSRDPIAQGLGDKLGSNVLP